MKKQKNNALIIFLDKEKKQAIGYEGDKEKLEAQVIGERHPKYRWKVSDMEINKNGANLEFEIDDIEKRKKLIIDIADKLKSQVDMKAFLIDKMEDYNIEEIKDIQERLLKGAKIQNKEGCFYLNIGGKKGRPKRFILSD